MNVIGKSAIERRNRWIDEIVSVSGNFGSDTSRVSRRLAKEIKRDGTQALLDHLRLCTAIPESYGHASSEEKLYSKYTDILLTAAYSQIGLESKVLEARANSADVEAVAIDYSFVADAKVFRLSRTAKNQKDFKIQSMDGWKFGRPFAMVVCPLYQIPSRASQIYEQASTRNVCIFSYSHLAVLVQLSVEKDAGSSTSLLHEVFKVVQELSPSKDATSYWQAVNQCMLAFDPSIADSWKREKVASAEGIAAARSHALSHYRRERDSIRAMSRNEAIEKLVEMHKIDSREETIKAVSENDLMNAHEVVP